MNKTPEHSQNLHKCHMNKQDAEQCDVSLLDYLLLPRKLTLFYYICQNFIPRPTFLLTMQFTSHCMASTQAVGIRQTHAHTHTHTTKSKTGKNYVYMVGDWRHFKDAISNFCVSCSVFRLCCQNSGLQVLFEFHC